MAYFAKVDPTATPGIFTVTQVIRSDQAHIDTLPGRWLLTDYNTYGNVHYAPCPPAQPFTPDGGIPIRGNFAGINYVYNSFHDVFYVATPPFPSWHLSETTWLWEAPIPKPDDGKQYAWDEANQRWVEIVPPVKEA